jgi:hypothetical protein
MFSALVAIPKDPLPAPCNLDRNLGWKYMLLALGLIVCAFHLSCCHSMLNNIYMKTFAMFIAHIVFFCLHKSPHYLVQAGHPQDTLESLQMISRFNGSELYISLNDVEDHIHVPPTHAWNLAIPRNGGPPSLRLFDADAEFSSSPTEIKPLSPLPVQGLLSAHHRQTVWKVLFQSRTTLLLADPRHPLQHMLCLHPSITRICTKSPLRQGETLLMMSPHYPKRKKILKMILMCHQHVCIHHSSVPLQRVSAP